MEAVIDNASYHSVQEDKCPTIVKAFNISTEDWALCCRHVKDVEKRFYATDIAVDDQVDRLVITVTSIDEDTVTASDCDGGSIDDERTDTASGGHEAY